MAIYNAGYLSPIRKKLGNAVGRKWRTLDVLAVYQPFVSNPNTIAQRNVRGKFGALAGLSMRFAIATETGFEAICKGTKVPQRSMFIRKNWDNLSGDYEGYTVAYDDLVLSEGSLSVPEYTGSLDFTSPLTVKQTLTSYTGDSTPFIDKDDEVYMAVYSPEAQMCWINKTKRSDARIDVEVPALANGHRVHCYLFGVGVKGMPDEGKVSDTVYLGTGTIQ